MGVHSKLMEARLRLQAAELKKTGHNKFAGYNYFELDVEAHKGPLTLSVTDSYQGFLVYLGLHF
jgi:hypothetical protein